MRGVPQAARKPQQEHISVLSCGMRHRWMRYKSLVGMVNGFTDAHGAQVIGELLGAVETYHVRLAVGDTRLIDRSERTRQMPMRAVEQQVQNRVDHRFAPLQLHCRCIPMYRAFGLLALSHGDKIGMGGRPSIAISSSTGV